MFLHMFLKTYLFPFFLIPTILDRNVYGALLIYETTKILLVRDLTTGSYGIRLGEIVDKQGKPRIYVTQGSAAPVPKTVPSNRKSQDFMVECTSQDTLKMLLLGDELVGVNRSAVDNMTEACEKLQGVEYGGTAIVWVSYQHKLSMCPAR